MERTERNRNSIIFIGLIVGLFVLFSGCSYFQSRTKNGTPSPKPGKTGPSPLYYDFEDVLVPGELKINRNSSFVYRTPGFSSGILSLKGRVEIESLIAFFKNNMAKDNWRAVSSFKSLRSIMMFHKENRWCVISITEKQFSTYVEIWVVPTIQEVEQGSETKLLK